MRKTCALLVFLLAICISDSYCQLQDTSQSEFLKNAPQSVREYYRAFDSLAHPTWKGSVYKNWSLSELKKYSSAIYYANEYDPIAKQKYDILRAKTARDARTGWVGDAVVTQEVKKRISEKHAALIHNPYWLTIIVDSIETLPYTAPNLPKTTVFMEKRIHGKTTKVWKGRNYYVGDAVTAYYFTMWKYGHELFKGNSYIIALYPLSEDFAPDDVRNALGGMENVQRSVFPIVNGYVIDEDNLFQLGKKVELNKFTQALQSTINEIKSWKEMGQ